MEPHNGTPDAAMAENLVFYDGFEAPWNPTMDLLRHPWQKISYFTTLSRPWQALEEHRGTQ